MKTDFSEEAEEGILAEIFEPGDQVPASGVYKASHGRQHLVSHYVTALFGETFPSCLGCSDQVRFELALSAVYVHAHAQFSRLGPDA